MTTEDPFVPPALEVRGLCKAYGNVRAVDGVDLTIERGEIVGLVGPSGCGKSTLIRLVTGLVTPDAGTVRLAGREVAGEGGSEPPEKRRIGVVFQEHSLFPHLTVAANVAFGLAGRGRGDRRNARVTEVLELVDLPHTADRYPHELSGGERQRIGLARALAPEPEVILLDEPFASLDPNLRQRIRTQTLGILRDAKASALLVTHDQVEAMAMGDRVAVMSAGTIQQVDTPERVFHQPCNRFVATFLGEADFLPFEVHDGQLVTEVGACPVPDGPLDGDMMVRPHEVTITADPHGSAVVAAVEYQGAHVLYDVLLPSGARLRALAPHTFRIEPDTPVRVRVEHGHAPAVLSDAAGADRRHGDPSADD